MFPNRVKHSFQTLVLVQFLFTWLYPLLLVFHLLPKGMFTQGRYVVDFPSGFASRHSAIQYLQIL